MSWALSQGFSWNPEKHSFAWEWHDICFLPWSPEGLGHVSGHMQWQEGVGEERLYGVMSISQAVETAPEPSAEQSGAAPAVLAKLGVLFNRPFIIWLLINKE